MPTDGDATKAWIFDIQRYSIQDGPGIRTTVFFKGCPLRCLWCDNPESQRPDPQLLYFETLCGRCFRCVAACPNGATAKTDQGTIAIDRALCRACGSCVPVCRNEARAISGRQMTVDDVLRVVEKDALFYKNSGGGVTASGGEATNQPAFLGEFLAHCQDRGFQTALETCGHAQWEQLARILRHVDLVLFDLKHMDSSHHRALTGVDNDLILRNAARIAQSEIPMVVRMPLITGLNDSPGNIDALGRFARASGIRRVDLLPYHQFGRNKYAGLGLAYKLKAVTPLGRDQIEAVKVRLEAFALEVSVV